MNWFITAVLALTYSGEQVTAYRSELVRSEAGVYSNELCTLNVRLERAHRSAVYEPATYHITERCASGFERSSRLTVDALHQLDRATVARALGVVDGR